MKKLILTAAIVLGGLSTINAQMQDQNTAPTEQKAPATEEFTEIKAEDLPSKVTEALKKSYPDAVLSKAYINEKKEYKLEITVKDQLATVYTDVDGNWIQK
ncbi:hypothetical protein [Flavobacterium daejeonense]|uniref:hypothetical protein n=1 Tax=Flavobacterium daejeonense TaxID=350893 RepID=UPI00047B16B7|nr:hypothetical protein [Flavobacterium daejeonense]